MAAIGFVLALRGEQWALEDVGLPALLRRKFKKLQLAKPEGVSELRYFDSFGHSKRQRFRGVVADVVTEQIQSDNEQEIGIEDLPIDEDEEPEPRKPRNRFTAKKRK